MPLLCQPKALSEIVVKNYVADAHKLKTMQIATDAYLGYLAAHLDRAARVEPRADDGPYRFPRLGLRGAATLPTGNTAETLHHHVVVRRYVLGDLNPTSLRRVAAPWVADASESDGDDAITSVDSWTATQQVNARRQFRVGRFGLLRAQPGTCLPFAVVRMDKIVGHEPLELLVVPYETTDTPSSPTSPFSPVAATDGAAQRMVVQASGFLVWNFRLDGGRLPAAAHTALQRVLPAAHRYALPEEAAPADSSTLTAAAASVREHVRPDTGASRCADRAVPGVPTRPRYDEADLPPVIRRPETSSGVHSWQLSYDDDYRIEVNMQGQHFRIIGPGFDRSSAASLAPPTLAWHSNGGPQDAFMAAMERISRVSAMLENEVRVGSAV